MPIRGNTTNELQKPTVTSVEVEEASTEVLKENLSRSGAEFVNSSTSSIFLMLGKAAELKKGIFLTASGGSWNGMVGPMVWTGSVFAIAGGAKSFLTVVEV